MTDIKMWNLFGVRLQHFDGDNDPRKVLKATSRWIRDNDIKSVSAIRIENIYDTEFEEYRFVGTVEY